MSELRQVCRTFGISWSIYIAQPNGELRRTKDADRKLVTIERLHTYLETGEIEKPTTYPSSVLATTSLAERPTAQDRLYYGHYDKKHTGLLDLLSELTDGKFRNGAVARLLCRSYWERGETPTFETFTKAWLRSYKQGLGIKQGEHPEAAYLTDRARGKAGSDWKKRRETLAKEVLEILNSISPR